MRKKLAAYVLAIGSSLYAADAIKSGGFYEAEKLTSRETFPGFERAREATVKVWDGNYDAKNSGTFVSSYGHLLTTAHSVKRCLNELGAGPQETKVSENIKAYTIDRSKLDDNTCLIDVNGHSTLATVLATGIGELDFSPYDLNENEWKKLRDLKQEGYGEEADFALLKTYIRPQSCVDIFESGPSVGSPVWAIGFPTRTNRRGEFPDSDGISLYVSKGHRINSIAGIEGLKDAIAKREYHRLSVDLKSKIGLFSTDEIISLWSRVEDSPEIIQHTADMTYGSSGGGLYNNSGNLAGVNVALSRTVSSRYSFENYVAGSTRSISTESIMSQIRAFAPSVLKDLKCNP